MTTALLRDRRAYLDNVICSGISTRDLAPPTEMAATLALLSARDRGELELLTSAESWREQGRAVREPNLRAVLAAGRDAVPRVEHDHTVLGVAHSSDCAGGYYAAPLVTDVVDAPLFEALRAAGLAGADARHVVNAVHNGCRWFVTLDTRDILPRKSAIEAACPGLRVVKPAELVTELNLSE